MIYAAQLMAKIGADVTGLKGGLNQANSELNQFSQSLGNVGNKLTLGLTVPMLGVGTQAFRMARDFDTNMNVLQATSQATAKEMGLLNAKAEELGADLKLPGTSAADAAAAMLELSKAGLSVNDTLGASRGVLELSAAGTLGNAQAAEITANALNMFGLQGKEASKVADLLAAAANASSAEVSDLADSLKMSGSVYATSGQSIETLTALIAEMANAGIKGSDAGTSLKQMLLSLQAPSGKAAEAMEKYGISVYDLQGQMLPMRDIIAQFTAGLGNLTQEQRNAALATIFGSDAVRAANIVLMNGVPAYDAMEKAVTRQGAAAELAGARMKGLNGAVEGLISVAQDAGREAFEPFQKDFEGLLSSVTNGIKSFSQLDEGTRKSIVSFGLMAAGTGPAMSAVGALVKGAGELAVGLAKIPGLARDVGASFALLREGQNIFSVMSLGASGFLAVLGPVAAMIGSVAAVWAAWNQNVTQTNQAGASAMGGAYAKFFEEQAKAGKDAESTYKGFLGMAKQSQSIANSGIAGFFAKSGIEKGNIEGLKLLNGQLRKTSLGWEEYRKMMLEAGQAAGVMPDLSQLTKPEQEWAIRGYAQQIGMLSREMWNAEEPAQRLKDLYRDLGTESGLTAEKQARLTDVLQQQQQAELGLKMANEQLGEAQRAWSQGAGGEIASTLKNAGLSADMYKTGLGAVDEVMGTSFLLQKNFTDDTQRLVEQFRKTGDVAEFKTGMEKLMSSFQPLDEKIRAAIKTVDEFKGKLEQLPKSVVVDLVARYSIEPPPTGVSNQNSDEPAYDKYRASGGNVRAFKPYITGEFGPELYIPSQNGRILDRKETQQVLGKGDVIFQPGAIQVVLNTAQDTQEFAYQLAMEIQRRQ